MATVSQRIDISDLKPGMYLEEVYNDKGVYLLSANVLVATEQQIETLRRQGIKSVFVNPAKGIDQNIAPHEELVPEIKTRASLSQQEEAGYYEELPRAKEVRQKTFDAAKEALSAIRNGRGFNIDKIEKSAEEIAGSILRNPDALVSLCQIKGYDEYTYVHSVNVSVLLGSLADSMGYTGEDLLAATMGGLLHDIGKMKVPESILNKPGKYSEWEFDIMKKHPVFGLELVAAKLKVPERSRKIIVQHHERFNGSGYPYGLKGAEIDEFSVAAAVADVYDALTSDRVYRAAWTPQKALALIFQGCDADYSRNVVERFTRHLGVYPVGSFVKLFSGEMGIVTQVEKGELLAPEMIILFDRFGHRVEKPITYRLAQKQKEPDGNMYKIEISLNPKAYRIDVAKFLGKPVA